MRREEGEMKEWIEGQRDRWREMRREKEGRS